jgi:hypothetical protein
MTGFNGPKERDQKLAREQVCFEILEESEEGAYSLNTTKLGCFGTNWRKSFYAAKNHIMSESKVS